MQLNLTDTEVEYIKTNIAPGWWIADSILSKISSANEMIEERKNCKHEFGKYTGEKECCVKCQALGVLKGESWKLITKEEK